MSNSFKPLIWLASASPRRSALLTQIGIAHHIRAVDVDETAHHGELPLDYVQRLSVLKAQTLWDRLAPAERLPVLGSDTTVALETMILGKPHDRADALRILSLLSGRTHQVYTGVALRSAAGTQVRMSVSDVTFRRLSSAEMAAYWDCGEPEDKAGAYAIQGRAGMFIEHMSGSYSGIVGLPLFETAELLHNVGIGMSAEKHSFDSHSSVPSGAHG